jgi:hypothetical protein
MLLSSIVSTIYFKHGEDLTEMVEAPYEAEDVLQQLLADYPALLAGDRDGGERRRWTLVSRELGIGSDAGGPSRWSLDHLFLDHEGIPTLVEVKRSTDTRIRREVVGQMLDYAANGAKVWSLETIRASFVEGRADPVADLVGLIGPDGRLESFWEQVGANLKAGRLRLVFVADEIPPELQRVVEFLNEQMASTEVLALEVKQYREVDGDRLTLVPRLIGRTESARQMKEGGGRSGRTWTREEFSEALLHSQPTEYAERMESLIDRLTAEGARLFMGSGKEPSVNVWIGEVEDTSTRNPVALSFYMKGVAINLDYVRDYRSEAEMERLVALIRQIPGVAEYFAGLEDLEYRWGMRPTMDPRDVLAGEDSVTLFAQKIIEASSPPLTQR